ncbi:MAG: pyruvate carboxylase [Pseudomonadota bacterium]
MPIKKILVANRSEIAIRVMRAANELGLQTVAVYSKEDRLSLHRFKADESYLIGEHLGPVKAYLAVDEIIRAAKNANADAIHPGYGFLSENPDFVDACDAAGLVFIGPGSETMRQLGDKASARRVAIEAGVPVIPASGVLGGDFDQIRQQAASIGYPLMLKASWGGGGRGMRTISGPQELEHKILEGRREAETAFGNGEGFLEKLIERARHVEVQILGDANADLFHLWERDCSIQRRNQKVVERAPAPYLSQTQREYVCSLAKKIGNQVKYCNAGTVEFLMDMDSGEFFFIEVNPRVQVEHTVTEQVTGIDIVRAQILIADGIPLAEATGISTQADVPLNGHAIQCRVTTEDPRNNFIPDYGRITAYRPANGMGIRLDGGTAYAGAVITRFYDSLLAKVTAWGQTSQVALARLDRSLREFRVRGVSTNINFVENLLRHPSFLDEKYTTKFIDTTPDLLNFSERKDRATKLLTYIAETTVRGHPDVKSRPRPEARRLPNVPKPRQSPFPSGIKTLLETNGPQAVADYVLGESRLLVTDTTMRDAHQSLLATRMRSYDMFKIAPVYAERLHNLFSLECWGGATFDVAYRFLKEDPWQRLSGIRESVPNILLQMLLRGSNAVGYKNYPDNVVQAFVARASETGVDLFRVFDSLNWAENMKIAIAAVLENERICEGTICYTGDILNPARSKYDLDYYVELALDLKSQGIHILGLKDMAGLLKPDAARLLVRELKAATGLPVHLHTHDTSGISAATLFAASEAGVDIVDTAMDALSGTTSQPCLGSLVEAMKFSSRDTGLDSYAVREVSRYWQTVRSQYAAFETENKAPASEVYLHEMPGGQFTNLQAQAASLGLLDRWAEIAEAYAQVNMMFGDIVKVTPSSKVVGDLALMMVSQGLSRKDVEDPTKDIAFPASTVSMLRGELGQTKGGWPKTLQKKALNGREPLTERPGARLEPANFASTGAALANCDGARKPSDKETISATLYPETVGAYLAHLNQYGPVCALPTPVFFYGMNSGESVSIELEKGKTLEITLVSVSEQSEAGWRSVFFELNGQPRTIKVQEDVAADASSSRPLADPQDVNQVGAPMPGRIVTVAVQSGDKIKKGDVLIAMEAMKMETTLQSASNGIVEVVLVQPGDDVDAKELLIRLTAE